MNGASTANGAIVMIRKSTTRPRAWSTDVLKKIVPASAIVTNASAAPLTAVSLDERGEAGPARALRTGDPVHEAPGAAGRPAAGLARRI